jgi:hypothetical protein
VTHSLDDDPTELRRRVEQLLVNEGAIPPDGQTWTTEELQADFEVRGFLAPYVVVRRKADGLIGSLMFRHSPRLYFGWREDVRQEG